MLMAVACYRLVYSKKKRIRDKYFSNVKIKDYDFQQ
jgi:hypothetical protein